MGNINIQEQIAEVERREKTPEQRLGRCLKQPFTGMNSGPRKLMYSIHQDHRIQLANPDVALITTGSENEFAKHASCYVEAEDNFEVLAKIEKFSFAPGVNYWLILKNVTGKKQAVGTLDIVARKSYEHTTEDYGYALNNDYFDSLRPGDCITAGDRIRCSASMDEYGNIREGKNLLTQYISDVDTEEDGIKLSKTAAKELSSVLYPQFKIILNDNDIMLNLYSDPFDKNDYSVMPDIGHDVKDGVLCAVRRQTNAEAMYSQAWDQLKRVTIADEKYTVSGTLIDLDIFVNNPDQFENSPYHRQLKDYYYNKLKYSADIVAFIESYKHDHGDVKLTYELEMIYVNAKKTIARASHMNEKVYSGTIIEVTLKQALPMSKGDKMSNRYGGKSVVSKIVDDELMPRTSTGDIIHVSTNKAGVTGRLNYGQLFETEINHRSAVFIEHVQTLGDNDLIFEMVIDYINIISPRVATQLKEVVSMLDDYGKTEFIASYVRDGAIALPLLPLSDHITIDTLNNLDLAFPWIKQRYTLAPIIDSNGNVRYTKSMRPMIIGKQYFIRLKQHAKEKFSATSISTVNIRNENSKSKASKLYKSPISDTPIRFGSMEIEDLTHMDADGGCHVIVFVMMYSSSPAARRNFIRLFTGDPIEHNITLDEDAVSRGAESFNVYMKQNGYRLVIEKHLIEHAETPFTINVDKPAPFDIVGAALNKVPFTIDDDNILKVDPDKVDTKPIVVNEDGSITDTPDKNVKYNAIPFNIIYGNDSETGEPFAKIIK